MIALGLCSALGAAACTARPVPDSAADASARLVTEAIAVTQACLDHGFGRGPVLADLDAAGFAARVPLSPVLSTTATTGVRVLRGSPCTLQVDRAHARTLSRAMDNTLRARGFVRDRADTGLWTDGRRSLRKDRATIRTPRYHPNDVAFSLSPAG